MLVGMAIRSEQTFAVSISRVVFKAMLGEPMTEGDLERVDVVCYNLLNSLREDLSAKGVDESNFSDLFAENFCTVLSDGTEVNLVPDGHRRQVDIHSRFEYVRLVFEARLNEARKQGEWLREGISAALPLQALANFTWKDLELRLCGSPEIPVRVLKRHTQYQGGLSEASPSIELFWKVLEGFTDEQRSQFLRFTWGRARLPYREAEFTDQLKIGPFDGADGSEDRFLPTSHTCFFKLDWPNYSCVEVAREKLLYAIQNCQAIDTDNVANDFDDNDE
eukprot:comp16806_c0_seq1/m.27362 comp16806_c0_seq1/g.27362  ORF comp16806_c0_seq1/g.27362 comp16806_c0_seq1/m.27362 type:complete len:277 (-) comp16806_c0_seq1:129-959(-)